MAIFGKRSTLPASALDTPEVPVRSPGEVSTDMVSPVIEPGDAAPLMTDDGIPYRELEPRHIVNLAEADGDSIDVHRRELRVNGRVFMHVSEDAQGRWIYRNEHDD